MNAKLTQAAIESWARLIRAQQLLIERVESDLTAAELPPLAWYDVLLEINREDSGQLRQFEIGDKVLLSKYNVSRLLDRLENEGLVERQRCEQDRRGANVIITKSGKALLKKMWVVYERGLEQYFSRHLSKQEIEQLAVLTARLIENPD